MSLRVRFDRWVEREIGSHAPPALREHLRMHDYRVFSSIEDECSCQREVYHPEHGFFRAVADNESEALHQILLQVWLTGGLSQPEPEVGEAGAR